MSLMLAWIYSSRFVSKSKRSSASTKLVMAKNDGIIWGLPCSSLRLSIPQFANQAQIDDARLMYRRDAGCMPRLAHVWPKYGASVSSTPTLQRIGMKPTIVMPAPGPRKARPEDKLRRASRVPMKKRDSRVRGNDVAGFATPPKRASRLPARRRSSRAEW